MSDKTPVAYVAGTVGTELETRSSKIGDLTKFRMAVTREYGDGAQPEWWSIVIKSEGLQASAKRELYRGAKIVVQGRPSSEEYNGKLQWSMWADKIGLVEYLRKEQAATPASQPVAVPDNNMPDDLGF